MFRRMSSSPAPLKSDEIQTRIGSHDASISILEKLLFHHRRAVARYRGSLNETEPAINRLLPTEILSEIFIHYREMCPLPYSYLPPYAWSRVAHVCRTWRNIALANPFLFNHLTFSFSMTCSSRTKEFVRLANRLPLHLNLYPRLLNDYRKCIPLLPRTQSLYIKGNEHERESMDLEWPVCPALSCFTWKPSEFQLQRDHRWFNHELSLHAIMPNLRYLNIHAKMLGQDWLSHSLPRTIKTLVLNHPEEDEDVPLGNIDAVIQKLIELPQLESLSIPQFTLDNPALLLSSTGSQLGCLKHLRLKGSLFDLLAFLDRVRSVDWVDLDIKGGNYSGKDVQRLAQMLQSKLTPIRSRTHLNRTGAGLRCRCAPTRALFLLLLTSNEGHVYNPLYPFPVPQMRIHINKDSFFPFLPFLANGFSSQLSLVTECRLDLYGDCENLAAECSTMRAFLRSMPSLVVLELFFVPYSFLLTHLAEQYFGIHFPTMLCTIEKDGIILPRLRNLTINLDELNVNSMHSSEPTENYCPFFMSLRSALGIRKALLSHLGSLNDFNSFTSGSMKIGLFRMVFVLGYSCPFWLLVLEFCRIKKVD